MEAGIVVLILPANFLTGNGHLADVALVYVRPELRKINLFVFLAVAAVRTTCQSRKADTIMTAQNSTVLTVEFT